MIPPGAGRFVLGDRVQLKISAAETAGAFSLFQGVTPPGKGRPLHRHEYEDECFVVLAGNYEMRCGSLRTGVRAGDCVFLPRRIPHTFRNCGRRPASLFELVVPGGLERYFEAVSVLGPETTAGLERRNQIGRPFGLSFPVPGVDDEIGDANADGAGRFVFREDGDLFELESSMARWSMPPSSTGGRVAILDISVEPGRAGALGESPGGHRVTLVRSGEVEIRVAGGAELVPRGGVVASGSLPVRWRNPGGDRATLLIGCVAGALPLVLSNDGAAA